MPLTLKSRFVGNVYIIQCKGRIVLGDEVKVLEAALEVGAREFTRIVLDLTDIDRLDSIGLGLLVRYAERLDKRGGGLRLATAPTFVVTLLNMTRLSTLLQCFPTEEEAIMSFLRQAATQGSQERRGPRVLLVDESADLCVFVRTVLIQQGYDVRSTCSFRDAKILLQVDGVDYILVGPGSLQLPSETILSSLKALAPNATALKLDADFRTRDAHEASETLLKMFGASGVS